MKFCGDYFDTPQFLVTDYNSSLVMIPVNSGAYRQTCFGRGVGNKVNNYFVAGEWATAPVLADETEEAMFDLVPFAGPRRKMTNFQPQAQVIGQLLQSDFPKTIPTAVAPPAVRRNHQFAGTRKAVSPHLVPPPPNARRGEASRVVVDPDAHPTFVAG